MSYEIVYETEIIFYWPVLIPALLMVLGILSIVFGCKAKVNRKKLVLPALVTAIAALMILSVLYQYFRTKADIYDEYKKGHYEIAEGVVSEFHAMPETEHDSEHFLLNGIYFSYPDLYGWGYSKCRKDGGVISGDGQSIRITYLPYRGENVIMKLEIVE